MTLIGNATALSVLDTQTARLNGGTLLVYAGTPPTDLSATLTGVTLLATLTLNNPAFGAATDSNPGAQAVANAIVRDASAAASGDISFVRLVTTAGVVVFQLTAGEAGDAVDGLPVEVEFDDKTVIEDGVVALDDLVLLLAESSAV